MAVHGGYQAGTLELSTIGGHPLQKTVDADRRVLPVQENRVGCSQKRWMFEESFERGFVAAGR